MLLNSLVKFYMLYTVHYIIIIKNYRNAQIIKVSSPYFTTTQCTYYYTDIFTHPNKFLTFLIPTVNIQHDGLDLENIFIHNFILDHCTYCHVMILCNTSTLMMVKCDRNM